MNIVLFGFKNCGKTRISKALSREIGWKLLDIDRVIEEIYLETRGQSLSYSQIAKKHGMDFFRQVEREAVQRVSAKDKKIIALGGGTPLFFDNLASLKRNGKMVLLNVDKEELFRRIIKKGIPFFFDPEKPRKSFEELFQQRIPRFEEIYDFKVDCNGKESEQIAEEIMGLVGKG